MSDDELAAAEPVTCRPCTACAGRGETCTGGYYVPGEQFCEPPFQEPCAACVGTGWADVQRVVADLSRAFPVVEAAGALEGRWAAGMNSPWLNTDALRDDVDDAMRGLPDLLDALARAVRAAREPRTGEQG